MIFLFFPFFVSVGCRLPHRGGDSWAAAVVGHPVRQKPSRRLAVLRTAGTATSGKIHQHAARAGMQTLACVADFDGEHAVHKLRVTNALCLRVFLSCEPFLTH